MPWHWISGEAVTEWSHSVRSASAYFEPCKNSFADVTVPMLPTSITDICASLGATVSAGLKYSTPRATEEDSIPCHLVDYSSIVRAKQQGLSDAATDPVIASASTIISPASYSLLATDAGLSPASPSASPPTPAALASMPIAAVSGSVAGTDTPPEQLFES